MLYNHLKIFFRQFRKKPLNSLINILGLAIGLSVCGLIGMYIYEEWKVDRFQEKGHRLYRINSLVKPPEGEAYSLPTVGRPVGHTILDEVPEVEQIIPFHGFGYPLLHDNIRHYPEIYFAGERFFETFSFELLEGDPAAVLKEPYSFVITRGLKEKLFGDGPVIGQSVILGDSTLYTITGVAADPPPSHLRFEGLISHSSFYAMGASAEEWFTLDGYCYVLLSENADAQAAAEKIFPIPMEKKGDMFKGYGYTINLGMEPVSKIYLHSDVGHGLGPSGDASRLRLLGMIALFVLLIACINFVNLTTAQISERAKEIGVRKTVGAGRSALISQTLGEAMGLVAIGGLLAVLLMNLSLPLFNQLTDTELSMNFFLKREVLPAVLLFLLLTGLLAGGYPAILHSGLKPVVSLKGQYREGKGGSNLRRLLVVFQFSISIILIISTIVVLGQLRYMQNSELGFHKEQTLVINARKTPRSQFISNYEQVKEELLGLASVRSASATTAIPGQTGWDGQVVRPEGAPENVTYSFEVIPSDHDFVPTLGLKLKTGRNFSKDIQSDLQSAVLINEKACRVLGWTPEEAIGKKVWTSGIEEGRIVGVLEDYHHHGLQNEIKPTLSFILPQSFRYVMLRMESGNLQQDIQAIQDLWQSRFEGYPFEYFFLDEGFDRQYAAERRLSKVFGLFAFLGILTAALGLFALSVFMAEKRTKEIGIRKVLGAGVGQLVRLLSRDFLSLVIIAVLLASPVAWYLMQEWLSNFAFSIEIRWWMFVLAGLLALLIAFATVSIHSIRAALANPVEALKYE